MSITSYIKNGDILLRQALVEFLDADGEDHDSHGEERQDLVPEAGYPQSFSYVISHGLWWPLRRWARVRYFRGYSAAEAAVRATSHLRDTRPV